jgi:hypothetical protein
MSRIDAARLARGLTVCLFLLSAGCGSKGTITGTVSYQGKPLPSGSVMFVPQTGTPVTATIDDGKYTVEKVPTGPAKIGVTSVNFDAPSGQMAQMMMPPKDAPIPPEARKAMEARGQGKKGIKIPENYGDPEKSGLTHTVTGGQQVHDIPLK